MRVCLLCALLLLDLVYAATPSAGVSEVQQPIVITASYSVDAMNSCVDPGTMHFPWVELSRLCVIPGQKVAHFNPSVNVEVVLRKNGSYNVLFFDDEQSSNPYSLPYDSDTPFSCEELEKRSKSHVSNIHLIEKDGDYHFSVKRTIDASYTRVWYVLVTESCLVKNASCPEIIGWNVTWSLTDPPTSSSCYVANLPDKVTELITDLSKRFQSASLQSLTSVIGLSTFSVVVLYVTFVLLGLFSFLFAFWGLRVSAGKRLIVFHSFFICSLCSLSYLVMATGNGAWALRQVSVNGSRVWVWGADSMSLALLKPSDEDLYLVFWIRFVEWTVSTLLMMRQLCLIAGATRGATEFILGSTLILVGAIYTATVDVNGTRWLFAFVGFCWFFAIAITMAVFLRPETANLNSGQRRLFDKLAATLLVCWCGYGWAWFLGEGVRVLTNDGVAAGFAILDLATKGTWCTIILRANPSPIFPSDVDNKPKRLVAGVEYTEDEDEA